MNFLMNLIVYTLIAIAGVVGLFLLYSTVDMYNPPVVTRLSSLNTPTAVKEEVPVVFSALSWNIGYAGLDASEDFFMDGGKSSMPPNAERVKRNLRGIEIFLASHDANFISLQEVDENSSRSYGVDEVSSLVKLFKDKFSYYALNYKVTFVPVPVYNPMGKVRSGIAIFSDYKPLKVERWSLPGDYAWPTNLFQLKRCFIVSWYKVKGKSGKLVYVNLHLSAFDKGGKLRRAQLNLLKPFMLEEYAKGNYVVLTGDWNNMMPGINIDHFKFTTPTKLLDIYLPFPKDWTPKGWKWAYDPSIPSVRSDEKSYTKGENFTTVIDGFLVSPNVKILSVKTFDLGFLYSDHNPVFAEFELK